MWRSSLWSISWLRHQMFYPYVTISAAQARESDAGLLLQPFFVFSPSFIIALLQLMQNESKAISAAVRSCFITRSTLYNLHCLTGCRLTAAERLDVFQHAELALASHSHTDGNHINSVYIRSCRVSWINTACDSHLCHNEPERKNRWTHTWPLLQLSGVGVHPACTAATLWLVTEVEKRLLNMRSMWRLNMSLVYSFCI